MKTFYWSRVVHHDDMDAEDAKIYDIQTDLDYSKTLAGIHNDVTHIKGSYAFDPRAYKNSDLDLDLHQNELHHDELVRYGKMVSEIRQRFTQKSRRG